MRYLILLNRRYPYHTGESFLESEMTEAQKVFDQIILLPDEVEKGQEKTRQTDSQKVKALPLAGQPLKKRRRRAMLKGLRRIPAYEKVHREEKKEVGWSVKKRAYGCYFDEMAKQDFKEIQRLLKSVPFQKEDWIVIYSYWFFINAKAAVLLAEEMKRKGYRIRVVSRAHGFDLYPERSRVRYLPQQRELLQKMDMVYACSENGAVFLKRRYKEYAGKIQAARLGTEDWGIGKIRREERWHLVTCSRIVTLKRLPLFIQALEILEKDFRIRWTHIGDGPDGKAVRKEAEKRLKDVACEWKGMLKNQEVYAYYAENAVDCFVNVSEMEGLPVSIMEAISFGIPVIATDVGGTREIVVNDVSGRLVDREITPFGLAKEIRRMLQMPQGEFQMLRESARALWECRFRADENYRNFYQNLLPGREL